MGGPAVRWKAVGAAAVALAPCAAQANAGVGLFAVAIPFTLLALVPAILVEAPILSRMLRVSLKRGLWWSFLANLVSTVAGGILAIVADIAILAPTGSSGVTPNIATVLFALVPMFLLTWWIEAWIVRHLVQPSGGGGASTPAGASSPKRATLAANAASYALLALAVFLMPGMDPKFPRADARWRIQEVLAELGAEKTRVAEHFAAHGRFPEPRELSPSSRYAASIRREGQGRLVAVIHYPGVEGLHGATMVLQPRLEAGGIAAWDCFSPRPAHKFMPASCRQEEPSRGAPGSAGSPG